MNHIQMEPGIYYVLGVITLALIVSLVGAILTEARND